MPRIIYYEIVTPDNEDCEGRERITVKFYNEQDAKELIKVNKIPYAKVVKSEIEICQSMDDYNKMICEYALKKLSDEERKALRDAFFLEFMENTYARSYTRDNQSVSIG
jgi:hypothetical protein